jgi:transcriptional regulator with XRE-family HTH domain
MLESSEGRLARYTHLRRQQLDITAQQLATSLDVTVDYILELESGQRPLDQDKLYLLADALAVPRTYLCLMLVLEGRSPLFQQYFGEPLLAMMEKGGQA